MANQWFRLYAEFATDAKVQSMSEAMQRRLVMLFCLRCSDDLVTLHDDELAFALRLNDEELAETKALFVRKNFINEQWEIINWNQRQFVSDSSAERVKRHREKRKERGLPAQDSFSQEQRAAVYERDNHQCVYCGSEDDLTIDHKTSRARGGEHSMDNWQTACRPCNASKRDMNHEEFLSYRASNEHVTLQKRPQNTESDSHTDKKQNRKASSAEPQSDSTPEVIRMPLAGGKEFVIRESHVEGWSSAYPAVDVLRNLAAMRQWCLANPTRRKTQRGILAFCNSWLCKEQDRPSTWPSPQSRDSPKPYESARDKKRRETIEGLTGRRSERSEQHIIDIN